MQKRKIRVPDLAMGAPNFKAVCMGRALMIPGMVGKNLGECARV